MKLTRHTMVKVYNKVSQRLFCITGKRDPKHKTLLWIHAWKTRDETRRTQRGRVRAHTGVVQVCTLPCANKLRGSYPIRQPSFSKRFSQLCLGHPCKHKVVAKYVSVSVAPPVLTNPGITPELPKIPRANAEMAEFGLPWTELDPDVAQTRPELVYPVYHQRWVGKIFCGGHETHRKTSGEHSNLLEIQTLPRLAQKKAVTLEICQGSIARRRLKKDSSFVGKPKGGWAEPRQCTAPEGILQLSDWEIGPILFYNVGEKRQARCAEKTKAEAKR